ncbi:hypothetical protein ACB092_05G077500 [Castanea dentata]
MGNVGFYSVEKIGSTRSLLGWVIEVKKVLAEKIEEIFSCIFFFSFIHLVIQRLVEDPGNLCIDPLTKINIFSMIHRNKKESLREVLTRLGCESKKGSCNTL